MVSSQHDGYSDLQTTNKKLLHNKSISWVSLSWQQQANAEHESDSVLGGFQLAYRKKTSTVDSN